MLVAVFILPQRAEPDGKSAQGYVRAGAWGVLHPRAGALPWPCGHAWVWPTQRVNPAVGHSDSEQAGWPGNLLPTRPVVCVPAFPGRKLLRSGVWFVSFQPCQLAPA